MKLRWGDTGMDLSLSNYTGAIRAEGDAGWQLCYREMPVRRWFGLSGSWGFIGIMLTSELVQRRVVGDLPSPNRKGKE